MTNKLPRRKGLYKIQPKESVTVEISGHSYDGFGKLQFSGFLNGDRKEHYYLPNHQNLSDKLISVAVGSLVKATRLTKGHSSLACEYDVKIIRGPKSDGQTSLDLF